MNRVVLTTLSLAACVGQLPHLTIAEVNSRHEALNGKRIIVTGWLTSCKRYDCSISLKPDGQTVELRIGGSRDFDRSVAAFAGKAIQIEVEGTVDRACFDHRKDPGHDPDLIEVCTDRANQLSNPRLVRIIEQSPIELDVKN